MELAASPNIETDDMRAEALGIVLITMEAHSSDIMPTSLGEFLHAPPLSLGIDL